ncbi:MAG: sterol desaturase family protein [Planctomycetota bacterium]
MPLSSTIAAAALGVLLVAEAVAPAFAEPRQNLRRLVRHDLRNLLLGAANALLSALVFGGLIVAVDGLASGRGFGVVRWLGLGDWSAWAAALLMFDCWMYWWHRLNHAAPVLWSFHRAHHSDTAMDASSGVRFHPGEIALSGATRLAVVPLIGITVEQLAVYGAVALPVVLLQHANVRLPRWLDFGLFKSGLLVTPAMHRVHHSEVREETNSNYSSVLSIWDRLFGSLRERRDVENIRFGLQELRGERSQTLAGVLATPLENPREDAGEA